MLAKHVKYIVPGCPNTKWPICSRLNHWRIYAGLQRGWSPNPTTAAALRLFASQPHVQTLKDTRKTLHVAHYKAYHRGILQSRSMMSQIVFIYLFRQASIFTSLPSDSSNRSLHGHPLSASFAAPTQRLQRRSAFTASEAFIGVMIQNGFFRLVL